MQIHLSNSHQLALLNSLTTTTTTTAGSNESQKSWHLLALLLSIGHPTPVLDLASKCTLFTATPTLIQSLCSIPNSPITLITNHNNYNNNLYVTVSPLGFFALNRFLSNFDFTDSFLARIVSSLCMPRMVVPSEDALKMYFGKRKRIGFGSTDVDQEEDRAITPVSKRIRNAFSQVHFCITEDVSKHMSAKPSMSVMLNNMVLTPDLSVKAVAGKLSCELNSIKQIEDGTNRNAIEGRKQCKIIMAIELDKECALPSRVLGNQDACEEDKVDESEIDLKGRMNINATLCLEVIKKSGLSMPESVSVNDATNDCHGETLGIANKEEELFIDSDKQKVEAEMFFQPIGIVPAESDFLRVNEMTSLDNEPITTVKSPAIFTKTALSIAQKRLSKPTPKMKISFGDAVAPGHQAPCQSLERSKAVKHPKENKLCKQDHMTINMAQKLKQKHDDIHIEEGRNNTASMTPKDQVETKDLPCFESYVVEEEEGSGGYGTVYRARRKNDGATVAIKCPHTNAHRHHVSNELRMLERFGGKNFVIKYEGRFKSGNFDCFVLEHVQHDRPEVLKKEIDVFQLRWYGYCMFRALASLHKQGIIHRDVKPGNFLFSCKTSKGYLIDFNLAMDLHQKYGISSKLKAGNDVNVNHVTLSNSKSVPPTKSRKFPSAKSMDVGNQEMTKGLKSTLEAKNLKKKMVDRAKAHNELGAWSIMKSQGPDGSGITSVKDVTSTRTASAERLREPLPCQGRKELISLLQEAMQSPNHEASSVPSSMRKRIAAPPGKLEGTLFYLTPMPVHSNAIAVAYTGLIKNKGDVKHKKEGPCVGTKGFRAPEVLFRSLHQGPKVDIWSAGVTLLYLIIGRTPFYGDPEQNIKDIAKLRGSEDLWEVAKLHDRESSFPVELYNAQYLPSMTLQEWCKMNTKRRDFLDVIPSSIIDLVDKCLTVNPRLRISAEDALKHEFFAPCHEALRRQRLLRQSLSVDPGTSLPLHGQSISRSTKLSYQQA